MPISCWLGGGAGSNARRRAARHLPPTASSAAIEIRVPDIGDFKDVPVIEVLVKPGDRVKKNDSLVTLESEKASMEVPAEADGVVHDVKVKVGDKVSKGRRSLVLSRGSAPPQAAPRRQRVPPQPRNRSAARSRRHRAALTATAPADGMVHAGPVDPPLRARARRRSARIARQRSERTRHARRRARLRQERAAERRRRERVTRSPACRRGRRSTSRSTARSSANRSRASRSSPGPNLHRNWLQIPHITNYDEADVTSIEAFRNEVNAEQAKSGGPKLTMLAFLDQSVGRGAAALSGVQRLARRRRARSTSATTTSDSPPTRPTDSSFR